MQVSSVYFEDNDDNDLAGLQQDSKCMSTSRDSSAGESEKYSQGQARFLLASESHPFH